MIWKIGLCREFIGIAARANQGYKVEGLRVERVEGVGVKGFVSRGVGEVRCIELGFESYGSNVGFRDRGWVLPPSSNSWIRCILWSYISFNITSIIGCYWVGAGPKIGVSGA